MCGGFFFLSFNQINIKAEWFHSCCEDDGEHLALWLSGALFISSSSLTPSETHIKQASQSQREVVRAREHARTHTHTSNLVDAIRAVAVVFSVGSGSVH